MSISIQGRKKAVTELLNGTLLSMKTVIPFNYRTKRPQLLEQEFDLAFGVLIGITGDIRGKLMLSGSLDTFGRIGKTMSGMSLVDDMLLSFSGELGNMIAGGLSTNLSAKGTNINITSPTMLQGNTTLSGYKQGLEVTVLFESVGDMTIYLLID